MYFDVLKRLEWVESTEKTEPSAIQDNYPAAPERVYYRLTEKGQKADEGLWSNPLFTLYPEIGPSHMKKPD
jgi:DNA-binding PadR family transcriptional regulator